MIPVPTPLGVFHIAGDSKVERTWLPGELVEPDGEASPALLQAARELAAWATGASDVLRSPVRLAGTPFQVAVWRALQEIPYGETRTYGEIAAAVGRPGGARAVGQANNRNRVAPWVPCHRVVAHDGLGGYGGGEELKRKMLDVERSPGR